MRVEKLDFTILGNSLHWCVHSTTHWNEMKKVRRVLKTENDIYANDNFKPEFKTLMGLTKGEHDKACSYFGELKHI